MRVVGLQVYVMWLHLIVNTILPLFALIVLNTAIYRKLVKVLSSKLYSVSQKKTIL